MTDVDEKTTLSRPVEPVQVAIIGTGDGRVMPSGIEATTPGANTPNVVVTVVTPLLAILVRALNTFLTSLSGFVSAGLTPAGNKLLGAPDFVHLVVIGAGFAVAPVGFGLIKDLITIFGKLEQRYPLLSGSV